jgi:FdhD protein
MSDMVRSFDVVRVRGPRRGAEQDRAATEEPLEIRLHGRPFAVVMRTPGADRELTAGFLLAEQVIRSADDLGTIEYCTDKPSQNAPGTQGHGFSAIAAGAAVGSSNVVNVTLMDRNRVDRALADRRQVTTNASCGMCGRLTIESLMTHLPPIDAAWTMDAAVLVSLPPRLRAAQAAFDETGGLHAAGLFAPDGRLVDTAEDVGRHNAVDKVIGRMLLREQLPLSTHALCVSGRTSFEIVQKAAIAGIPLVAAVSAPSSLAIDLARESGVTLVGFVRDEGFNIYAHPHRIVG